MLTAGMFNFLKSFGFYFFCFVIPENCVFTPHLALFVSCGHDYSYYCLQILVQHIRAVLPGLKSRVSAQLTAVAKELAQYGDVVESKVASQIFSFSQLWCMSNITGHMIQACKERL